MNNIWSCLLILFIIETLNIPATQVPLVHVLSHPPGIPVRTKDSLSLSIRPSPVYTNDHIHRVSCLTQPVSYLPLCCSVWQTPQLDCVTLRPTPISVPPSKSHRVYPTSSCPGL